MTNDEYYDFVSKTGMDIKQRIMDEVMTKDMPDDEVKKEISNIKADVRKRAKVEMFGWGDFREKSPDKWLKLKNNNAMQIPVTTAIEWMTDDGKIKATKEEMVDYNNIAMDNYADFISDYLNEDANTDMKEINEATGNIVYDDVIKTLWSNAKAIAKGEVIYKRENKK